MTLMNFWNVLLGHKTSERGGMGREGGEKKRSRGEGEGNEEGGRRRRSRGERGMEGRKRMCDLISFL